MSGYAPEAIAMFLKAAMDGNELTIETLLNTNRVALNSSLDEASAEKYNIPAGWNALTLATFSGRIKAVRALVVAFKRSTSNMLEFKTPAGETALDLAFKAQQLDEDMNGRDQIAVELLAVAPKQELDLQKYFKEAILNDMQSTATWILLHGGKYEPQDVIDAIKHNFVDLAKILVKGVAIVVDSSDVQNMKQTSVQVGNPINVLVPYVVDSRVYNLMDLGVNSSFEMLDMLYGTVKPLERDRINITYITKLLELALQRTDAKGALRSDNNSLAVRILRRMIPKLPFKPEALLTATFDGRPFVFLATRYDCAEVIDELADRGLQAQFTKDAVVDAVSRMHLNAVAALHYHGVPLEDLGDYLDIKDYQFAFNHRYVDKDQLHNINEIVKGPLLYFAALCRKMEFLGALLATSSIELPGLLASQIFLIAAASETKELVATQKNLLQYICSLPGADVRYLPVIQALVPAMRGAMVSLDAKSPAGFNAADYAEHAKNAQILEYLQSEGIKLTLQQTATAPRPPVLQTDSTTSPKIAARKPLLSPSSLFRRSPSFTLTATSGVLSPPTPPSAMYASAVAAPGTNSPPTSTPSSRRNSSGFVGWMQQGGGCTSASSASVLVPSGEGSRDSRGESEDGGRVRSPASGRGAGSPQSQQRFPSTLG